jgi:hypothetical protein
LRQILHIATLLLLCFVSYGQSGIEFLQNENAASSSEKFKYNTNEHSSIQPQIFALKPKVFDTVPKCAFRSPRFKYAKTPLWLDANILASTENEQVLGAGIWFNSQVNKSLSTNIGIRYVYQNTTSKLIIANQTPTIFTSSFLRTGNSGLDIQGRIRYQLHPNIQFITGVDKNFIGEGNRSLLLSDVGNPYPFAQMQFKFWKFKYLYLAQFLSENKITTPYHGRKNAATHYLDFNIGNGFSIGLFESVIFQVKDTLSNRGFDLEYINPMVFFRPQEYNSGSADNVLIGVNASFQYKNVKTYGQLLIDEFSLKEIRLKQGWWGNKYGTQLGIKALHDLKTNKLFWRLEYNFVQRFTYTHLNDLQNYAHMGSALAHPLQAGFQEIVAELSFVHKSFSYLRLDLFGGIMSANRVQYSSINVGENIYQPYTTRLQDYGFYVQKFNKSSINPFGNLRLNFTFPDRFYEMFLVVGLNNRQQKYVSCGLRSKISKLNFNY